MDPTQSPVEAFEARYVRPHEGRALIVGSRLFSQRQDRRKLYREAVGVDMSPGDGVDLVLDLEADLPPNLGKFAHVDCLSVLEHTRRPWLLAANVERLLQRGGTLYVSVPWVWRVHDEGYGGDRWRINDQGLRELFPAVRWQVARYVSDRLRPDGYLPAREIDGHPFLPRCEVLAFGARK